MNNRKLTALVAVLLLAGFAAGTLVAQTSTPLGSDTFDDVPAGHWADEAIGWAVQNGITSGVGGGKFDPNGTVTRAQIITFLHRTVNLLEGNTPPTTTTTTQEASETTGEGFTITTYEEIEIGLPGGPPGREGTATEPSAEAYRHHAEGSWYCWEDGQGPYVLSCFGIGAQNPFRNGIGPVGLFSSLTVGRDFLCAVESTERSLPTYEPRKTHWPGPIRCWGNFPWYIGEGAQTTSRGEIALPSGDFVAVAGGVNHVCAVRDDTEHYAAGEIVCWGKYLAPDGQIVTPPKIEVPADPYDRYAIAIAVGRDHSCAVLESEWGGPIMCWGNNIVTSDTPPTWYYYLNLFSYWNADYTCGLTTSTPHEWKCWGEQEWPEGLKRWDEG